MSKEAVDAFIESETTAWMEAYHHAFRWRGDMAWPGKVGLEDLRRWLVPATGEHLAEVAVAAPADT